MVAQVSTLLPAPSPRTVTDHPARATLARQEARHDAALVLRFVAGDETAFVEIVTRYRAKMFHAAFGLLRNRADAEEIAQDTFIRAHRGLAAFRGDSSLAAWLYCIALNLARNRYWYFFRRRRHAMLPLDASVGGDSSATFAERVATDAPGPVREVVNNEFAALIALCTDRLPPGQREILTLRNVHQHSYEKIGRILGVRIGTVKSRVARARGSLRLLLGKSYPEFSPDVPLSACLEPLRSPSRRQTVCA